ncbi:MAG TPA: DNA-binding domain-containing protein [Gemmataceae bacterium]|nr:DNA-binding domain-containing protein [Gemmataceae bacterium]
MNPTNPPQYAFERIQRWMQAAVMHPDGVAAGMRTDEARSAIDADRPEQVVTRSKALTAMERLAIYGNSYFLRLLECMREEFPAVAHCLGAETFDAFSNAYLQKYPSRSYTLCQLGARFPGFLVETRPPREEGEPAVSWPEFLADLALYEWTFSEVFDGPGVEGRDVLDEEKVRAVPPERWPDARLVPVPCLRLLPLRFPVQEYHAQVREEKSPSVPAPAETPLAVVRRDYVVHYSTLSPLEYRLLSSLVAGRRVGEVIEEVAQSPGADLDHLAANLHDWFQRWGSLRFFQAVEWTDGALE